MGRAGEKSKGGGSTLPVHTSANCKEETANMKDQVVIVTGSGQGIGEATALRFSNEGASVVVVDIQEASGNETVQEIQR